MEAFGCSHRGAVLNSKAALILIHLVLDFRRLAEAAEEQTQTEEVLRKQRKNNADLENR